MIPAECRPNRRNFLKVGAAVATGVSSLALFSEPAVSQESDAWIIGPKPGFTPEIGTLVSMLAFTRMQVLRRGETKMGSGDESWRSRAQTIRGNSLDYYLDLLNKGRETTLVELKKRNDKWLAALDTEAGKNNYGKWFHVAEHESNHDGQIKFLKSRLPGAKPAAE